MAEEISFENAMERLESIVDQMESGDLPLETLLERYEEGTRMVKTCTAKLAAAEKRIETIRRKAAAEPEEETGSAELLSPKRSKSAKIPPTPSDSDPVSLF